MKKVKLKHLFSFIFNYFLTSRYAAAVGRCAEHPPAASQLPDSGSGINSKTVTTPGGSTITVAGGERLRHDRRRHDGRRRGGRDQSGRRRRQYVCQSRRSGRRNERQQVSHRRRQRDGHQGRRRQFGGECPRRLCRFGREPGGGRGHSHPGQGRLHGGQCSRRDCERRRCASRIGVRRPRTRRQHGCLRPRGVVRGRTVCRRLGMAGRQRQLQPLEQLHARLVRPLSRLLVARQVGRRHHSVGHGHLGSRRQLLRLLGRRRLLRLQ